MKEKYIHRNKAIIHVLRSAGNGLSTANSEEQLRFGNFILRCVIHSLEHLKYIEIEESLDKTSKKT